MASRTVVQNIHATVFPAIVAIGASATIATTYILSTYLGHNKPFPYTSISGTAQYSPTKYIYRCTMIPIGIVLIYVWNLALQWLKYESKKQRIDTTLEQIAFWLGVVGAVNLVISSCCLSAPPDFPKVLHGTTSGIFFALNIVAQDVLTVKIYHILQRNKLFVSNVWFLSKVILSVASTIFLVAALIVIAFGFPKWQMNICEWFGTATLLANSATFCFEWKIKMYSSIIVADPQEVVIANDQIPMYYHY
jgi:hypothetical protein